MWTWTIIVAQKTEFCPPRPCQLVELALEDDAGRVAGEPLLLHLDAAEAESVVEGPDVLAEDVSLEVVLKPELQEDHRGVMYRASLAFSFLNLIDWHN